MNDNTPAPAAPCNIYMVGRRDLWDYDEFDMFAIVATDATRAIRFAQCRMASGLNMADPHSFDALNADATNYRRASNWSATRVGIARECQPEGILVESFNAG